MADPPPLVQPHDEERVQAAVEAPQLVHVHVEHLAELVLGRGREEAARVKDGHQVRELRRDLQLDLSLF